jgi:DNA-binding NarL/FixJ family response regulator
VRVVIADDVMLLRSGLAKLLQAAGIEVAAECGNAAELLAAVEEHRPDVAIVDIRMPPTHTDEGLVAAVRIRATHPATAVLVLSQYVDPRFAQRLLADQPAGAGYLLKERVSDIAVLVDALQRISEGECVLDPTIVARLLSRRRPTSKLARLTEREHDVLQLLAEGQSNSAIAVRLFIAERTVESTCASIFRKLELEHSTDVNRRVLAVVELLRGS